MTRFWDDNHQSFVDLKEALDAPQPGVTSYSTIGALRKRSYSYVDGRHSYVDG